MTTTKSMQSVTNIFIVNLAMADMLVMLFCAPPSVIWDVTNTWIFGSLMCRIVIYIQVSQYWWEKKSRNWKKFKKFLPWYNSPREIEAKLQLSAVTCENWKQRKKMSNFAVSLFFRQITIFHALFTNIFKIFSQDMIFYVKLRMLVYFCWYFRALALRTFELKSTRSFFPRWEILKM